MIEQNLLNSDLSEILSKVQNDLSSGLLYTHTRITYNTMKDLNPDIEPGHLISSFRIHCGHNY